MSEQEKTSPELIRIASIYPGIDYSMPGYLYTDYGCGGCCTKTMQSLTPADLSKYISELEKNLEFAKELQEKIFGEPKQGDLWCVTCDMFLFSLEKGDEYDDDMKDILDNQHKEHLFSLRLSEVSRISNTYIESLMDNYPVKPADKEELDGN